MRVCKFDIWHIVKHPDSFKSKFEGAKMCGAGFSVTINGKLYTFEGSVSGLPEETEKRPKLELAAYRKNPYKQPL